LAAGVSVSVAVSVGVCVSSGRPLSPLSPPRRGGCHPFIWIFLRQVRGKSLKLALCVVKSLSMGLNKQRKMAKDGTIQIHEAKSEIVGNASFEYDLITANC